MEKEFGQNKPKKILLLIPAALGALMMLWTFFFRSYNSICLHPDRIELTRSGQKIIIHASDVISAKFSPFNRVGITWDARFSINVAAGAFSPDLKFWKSGIRQGPEVSEVLFPFGEYLPVGSRTELFRSLDAWLEENGLETEAEGMKFGVFPYAVYTRTGHLS